MKNIRPFLKTASYGMLLLFVNQIIFPMYSYAITGSSTMPEYSSFEPVSTSNMVNDFDGSLTYNIPLLNVPNGYPINLAYHSSSVNNEALSSWVGLGWNINPGVINRNKKGFPDEYDGEKITYHNRMPANWTISATTGLNVDLFGKEKGGKRKKSMLGANVSQTISFNNNNGLGTALNFGVSLFSGVANISGGFANGKYSGGSYSINPMAALNYLVNSRKNLQKGKDEDDAAFLKRQTESNEAADKADAAKISKAKSFFNPSLGPSYRAIPVSVTKSFGVMTSLQFDAGVTLLPLSIKPQGSITGSFSIQKNKYKEEKKRVYGYLNTEKAYDDAEGMMDFTMEMEAQLEKNDEILGYPMANPDNYSLSGEAFGGSFDVIRSDFGYFRPNAVRSEDIGVDAGLSVTTPINFGPPLINAEFGAGGSAAANYHQTDISEWENFMGTTNLREFKSPNEFSKSQEKEFYLFVGDQAGYFDLTRNPSNGSFDDGPFVPRLTNMVQATDSHYNGSRKVDYRSLGKHKKRSTHIVTHTNADFLEYGNISETDIIPKARFKTYERNLEIYTPTSGTSSVAYAYKDYPRNAIAEIVATNKDGLIYVYGLPVYERKEKSIQYSFKKDELDFSSNFSFSEDGLIATVKSSFSEGDAKRKVGQSDENSYPTTYLLTQILTPDYVDRTGDGPTDDDFGNFTQIQYQRIHGGMAQGDNWYSHRTPYTGVNFSENSLSSQKDDMGSFNSGQKEVYLVKKILSKTHEAEFKVLDRKDGLPANFTGTSSDESILKCSVNRGTNLRLKRLDEINLRARGGNAILSTVHFDYDYSIGSGSGTVVGLPNHVNTGNNSGKLTLKKVWVEHGGVSKNRIQPYEFNYLYPTATYSSSVGDSYASLNQFGLGIDSYSSIPVAIQNPPYKAVNTDGWGQYRNYKKDKALLSSSGKNLKRFFPYNVQDYDTQTKNEFDPAAYLLKEIILPSRGKIHIQYEQHDYSYVQDKNAMVMVPLDKATDNKEENKKLYYINTSKIGIDMPSTEAKQKVLAKKLFGPMLNGKRMYFNFLYALLGNNPNPNYNSSDYIEGFAVISSYGVKNGKFFFSFDLADPSGTSWDLPVSNPGKTSKREIPRKVCKDFYKSQRRLLVDGGQNATGLSSSVEGGDEKGMGKAFISLILNSMKGAVQKCKYMDPELSFVRLNLPLGTDGKVGKLAGGARVKRLLMYDDNTLDGTAVYGTEYLYRTTDPILGEISSGVATNEGGSIKMENPWVNPIDKSDISLGEAILGSSYMYKHMGPIGFGFMPSPSIGYSRVESRSIHAGKTGTGSTVNEFFTAKDRPCFMKNQSEDAPTPQYGKIPQIASSFGVPGFSVSNQEYSATQGIVVHLNDMHGKPKQTKVYASDGATVVSSTTYKYMDYEKRNDDFNKSVAIMSDQMSSSTAKLGEMGRKVSQYGYSKSIIDENVSVRATIDIDLPGGVVIAFVPIPIPGFLTKLAKLKSPVSASYTRVKYNTASVTKVVNHASIVTDVITQNDGITTHTSNVVFDDHTGDPVITSYKDDFKNGVYLEQNFRATWNYSGMKSKYQNEGLKITPSAFNLSSIEGYKDRIEFTFSSGNASAICGLDGIFQVGDLLQLNGSSSGNHKYLYHITKVDMLNNRIKVQKSMHSTANWLDPSTAKTINEIEIIKSGYSNQLNANMGQTVFFSPHAQPNYYSPTSEDPYDQSDPFVQALKNQIVGIQGGALTTIVTKTLVGPFAGVDVSSFADISSYINATGCDDIGIRNVVIQVVIEPGTPVKQTFSITSFDYFCQNKPSEVYTYSCTYVENAQGLPTHDDGFSKN